MATRAFIDANVLLDLALRRDQYYAAKELFENIKTGTLDGFVSPSIVHLVAYWVRKSHGSEAVKPFLYQILTHIHVVSVDHKITKLALASEMKDVEDSLQYYAALAHRMQIFISNDRHLKKVAQSSLPVVKPSEFILSLKLQ